MLDSHESSILYPTPWKVEDIQPGLYIYSRGNNKEALEIPFSTSAEKTKSLLLQNDYLINKERVTFIVHGFRNTVQIPWMSKLKDELLNVSDQTIILVGWGNGANLIAPRYLQAAANIQTVAVWLSDKLNLIKNICPSIPLWAIGHSLGCHLLGLAGRHSKKLQRLSALDPAGPGFEKHEFLPFRLCSSDAEFVDVIHTDGYDSFLDPEEWISPVNHYGTLIPLGSLDFYPNFGYDQPGAGPVSSLTIAGSHLRAIDLYIWSVKNPGAFETRTALDGIPTFESPIKKLKDVQIPAEMGWYAFDQWKKSAPLKQSKAVEGSKSNQYVDLIYYYLETAKSEPWVPNLKEIDDSTGEKEDNSSNSSYFSYCSII